VLGRAKLAGARLTLFRANAERGYLRAREAALELLAGHEEVDAADLFAAALAAPESGLVATAADVIAAHPQRAREAERGRPRRARKAAKDAEDATVVAPSPVVTAALLRALSSQAAKDDLEMLGSLVDAAAALGLRDALPRVEELCRSSYPTAREHAAAALTSLRGQKATCEPPAAGDAPPELAALPDAPVTLAFETDAGALSIRLDPALAPVAVTRAAALARSGYYDGMVVHRVVPGFVTQFGAPHGDGFGGPPGPPLRCETSPLPFATLAVGVALAGRDTGSSQLFVMHARAPHLDGRYALIGEATGPWAAFVDGDRIRKVTVSP
jgi:cyclophilin family peptidyl-prolyl cis-trans isomerase